MEDLNNVPSSGTYGAAINEVNANFSLVVNAINSLEYATTKSKGIYNNGFTPSTTTLPNSVSGDWCMVLGTGNTFPARIWTFNGTTWAQGGTWNPDGINLNDYATTTALNTAIANSLAQATARMGYGECTVNGTSLSVSIPNFVLPTSGGTIHIKMSASGTGASTLNINNTGAKTLLYNGKAVSTSNTWEAEEIISVFYNGSVYMSSGFLSVNASIEDEISDINGQIEDIHSNVFATGLIDANCSWCSLGTSITWYNNHVSSSFTKGYQTRVMEKIKFSSFTNGGINGGTMATGGGSTGLGDNLSAIPLADLYTIEYGINDMGHSLAVGTMNDYINNTGTGTFYGAYRKVIDYIKSINIDAKIILCTPRKAYGFKNYLPAYWYSPKNGIYIKDYVSAVKEIAEYESLVVCDWFAESGANQENLANLSIDVALHPNDKGYEAMANLLIASMRKMFNIYQTDNIYTGEHEAKKQTVLPSLNSGGSAFTNKAGATIGPSIAALRNSILTKILSSVTKSGTMIVRVVNPTSRTTINTYTITGFSGKEMDVSSLNINVPRGCYVLFGNMITSGSTTSMLSFVTNSGTPHTEAYSNGVVNVDNYPTMSITLGYELTSI